jgi:DNA-binding transcriptional MerR regulator
VLERRHSPATHWLSQRSVDDKGLAARDPETVIDRLEFVRAAQAVGLSLGEIREVLALRDRGETPCHHVATLIQARSADVDAKIAELEVLRKDLIRLAGELRS